ncbi:hypothetical protein ACNOYE_20515 [Nannocystaceae bacterium ST9]
MKQFLLGGLLGVSVGATLVYVYLTMQPAALDPECGGLCGEGTACVEGRCTPAEPEPVVEVEEAPEGKSKRKGRRGRKGASADASEAEAGEGELASGPAWDDDSHVPRFDADADQVIGASDGSARLSDATIDRELAELDGAFQTCVREANERVAELGTGKVAYSFGVAGSGKVIGVNASAPANLRDAGLIPCVRKAVYAHRFPEFDGPTMKASSSFSVR